MWEARELNHRNLVDMNYHEGQTSVGCQKVASQQEFTCSKSTKKKNTKKRREIC